jgi:hypothetical protein
MTFCEDDFKIKTIFLIIRTKNNGEWEWTLTKFASMGVPAMIGLCDQLYGKFKMFIYLNNESFY